MDVSRIDPELRVFLDQLRDDWAKHPPLRSLSFPEARRIANRVRTRWTEGGPVPGAVREQVVETAAGSVRIRLYLPELTSPAPHPALVYMHGGGFMLFSLDTHDRLMREYVAAGGFAVIGVDYPLSPEAKFPIALDHVTAFLGWLRDGGAVALGLDPDRIAVGGDSAGANLAISASLRLRDTDASGLVKALLLNYGGFAGTCSDEAEAEFGGPGSVLDREEVDWFWGHYLADSSQLADPFACPVHAALHGLPPCFLVIPELDVATEHSLVMRQKLSDAGVAVRSQVYRGATHSFLEAMSVASVARAAIADGAGFVRAALSR